MFVAIQIEMEVSDEQVRDDAIELLDTMLSYMADNVAISSQTEGD